MKNVEAETNPPYTFLRIESKTKNLDHSSLNGIAFDKQDDALLNQYLKAINKKDKQLHEFVSSLHEQRTKWESKETTLTEKVKDLKEKLRKKDKEASKLKLKDTFNTRAITQLSLLVDQLKRKVNALEEDAIGDTNAPAKQAVEDIAFLSGAQGLSFTTLPDHDAKETEKGTLSHKELQLGCLQHPDAVVIPPLSLHVDEQDDERDGATRSLLCAGAVAPLFHSSSESNPNDLRREVLTEQCWALGDSTNSVRQGVMDPFIRTDESMERSLKCSRSKEVEEQWGKSVESRVEEAATENSRTDSSQSSRRKSATYDSTMKMNTRHFVDRKKSKVLETEHLAKARVEGSSKVDSHALGEIRGKNGGQIEGSLEELVFDIEKVQKDITTTASQFSCQNFLSSNFIYHRELLMIQKERDELKEKLSLLSRDLHRDKEAQNVVAREMNRLRAVEDTKNREVEELKKEFQESQNVLIQQLEGYKRQLSATSKQLERSIEACHEQDSLYTEKLSHQKEEILTLQSQIEAVMKNVATSERQLLEEQWRASQLEIENTENEERLEKTNRKCRIGVKTLMLEQSRLLESAKERHEHTESMMKSQLEALEIAYREAKEMHRETCEKTQRECSEHRVLIAQLSCAAEEDDSRHQIAQLVNSERTKSMTEFFYSVFRMHEKQRENEKAVLEAELNALKEEVECWRSQCRAVQRRSEEVEKVAVETIHDLTAIHNEAQSTLSRSFALPTPSQTSHIASRETSTESPTSPINLETRFSSCLTVAQRLRDGNLRGAVPPLTNLKDQTSSLFSTHEENDSSSGRPFHRSFLQGFDPSISVPISNSVELEAILAQQLKNEKLSQELHSLVLQSGYDQIHALEDALSSKVDGYNSLKAAYRDLQQQLKENESSARETEEKCEELSLAMQEMQEKYKKEPAKMDALIQHYADRATHAFEEKRASRGREVSLLEELEKYESGLSRRKESELSEKGLSTKSCRSPLEVHTGQPEETTRASTSKELTASASLFSASTVPSEHPTGVGISFPREFVNKDAYENLQSECHSYRQAYARLECLLHQTLKEEKIFFVDTAYEQKSVMAEIFLNLMVGKYSMGIFEVERSCRGMCYNLTLSKQLAEKQVCSLENQLNCICEKMRRSKDHRELEWEEREENERDMKLISALHQVQSELQQVRRDCAHQEELAAIERSELQRKLEEKGTELVSLQSCNSRCEKEIRHYKDQIEKLVQQAKESESVWAELKRESEAHLQDATLEMNSLRIQLENASVKEDHLLSELKALQQEAAFAKQIGVQKEKDIQIEKAKLKEAIQQLDEVTTERNNSFAEALRLREVINTLSMKVSAAAGLSHREAMQRSELQAEMESQLHSLQSRLSSTAAEKRALERQLEALGSQVDELHLEVEERKVSESVKQGIIQEKCSEISVLRQKVANEESIQHILENRWRESQERENALRSQLDEVRRSHQILKVSFETLQGCLEQRQKEDGSFSPKAKSDTA